MKKDKSRCGITSRQWRNFIGGLLVLAVMTATVGCEPLRKKFIRKRKAAQESSEDIPVLEPIDYPDKVYTAEDLYKQHYSLWQVWQREFLIDIEGSSNLKKQLYDFDQLTAQLQAMQALLTSQKQEKLKAILNQFKPLRPQINQPGPFQNRTVIRLNVESFGKKIREGYKFNQVKESLTKNVPNETAD